MVRIFQIAGMEDQSTISQLSPVSVWEKSKKGQASACLQVEFQCLHCPRRQQKEEQWSLLFQSQDRLTISLPKDLSQCMIVFLPHLPVKAEVGNECGTVVWKCGTADSAQKWMNAWNGFLVLYSNHFQEQSVSQPCHWFRAGPPESKQSSRARAYQVSKSNNRVARVPTGTHQLALPAHGFKHFSLISNTRVQTPKNTYRLWHHTYKCVQAA